MKNGISRPKEQEIYLKASLIREPGDLAAFLDVSCGDDQQLRTRIRKLLAVKPRPELFEPDPLIHEVMERLQAHGDGRPRIESRPRKSGKSFNGFRCVDF